MNTAERKYTISKVGTGDYLLPSNDAQTIWRIVRYMDGPSSGLETMKRDREFWGLWRWTDTTGPGSFVDTGSWDRWELQEGLIATRSEAIRTALQLT